MFPNKKTFPVTEHCLDYVTVINFACIIIETKIMNFELATHSANMFKITPEAISEDTNLKFFWGSIPPDPPMGDAYASPLGQYTYTISYGDNWFPPPLNFLDPPLGLHNIMIIYYHSNSDNALLLSFLLTCHPYIPFHFMK